MCFQIASIIQDILIERSQLQASHVQFKGPLPDKQVLVSDYYYSKLQSPENQNWSWVKVHCDEAFIKAVNSEIRRVEKNIDALQIYIGKAYD